MEVRAAIRSTLMLAAALALQSCAPGSATRSGKIDFTRFPVIYSDDYVVVRRGPFFDHKRYWRQQEQGRQLTIKLSGSDRRFMLARRLETRMTEEMKSGRASFMGVAFEINPGIDITLHPGSMIFTFSRGDSLVQVRDRGICIALRSDGFDSGKLPYRDSGDIPFLLSDKLQPERPSPAYPVVGLARLPVWAESAKIESVTIDPDLWRYRGPGVKEKPRLK